MKKIIAILLVAVVSLSLALLTVGCNKQVMDLTYSYERAIICLPNGEIVDGKVHNVQYLGGCNGNLQGIGRLVEGMEVDEVIKRVEGIHCGMKPTSCPDQLATALKEAKEKL